MGSRRPLAREPSFGSRRVNPARHGGLRYIGASRAWQVRRQCSANVRNCGAFPVRCFLYFAFPGDFLWLCQPCRIAGRNDVAGVEQRSYPQGDHEGHLSRLRASRLPSGSARSGIAERPLRQMRRVLRPEGSLLLVEMGLRRTARGRMVAASPKHHVGNASAVAVISTAVRHPDRSAPRFGWRFAVATQEHLCQVKF